MEYRSRPPTRLVIAIIVIRQAAQVGAVDTHDIDLTTVVIVGMIEVGRERHPPAIGRETGSLAVAIRGGNLMLARAIGIHGKDFPLPRFS